DITTGFSMLQTAQQLWEQNPVITSSISEESNLALDIISLITKDNNTS
ncbi:unnamed protein product, partial [marine sediment metagenome]